MRLVVVGTSGSGKTTMAKALSRALGLPQVELDALNWQPGWRALSIDDPDEFFRRVAAAAAAEAWVMDGNYTKAREAHWSRATAFVWMDTARWVVMRQVVWRSFNRAVTKRELWPGSGNRELFGKWLEKEHPIRWAWDTWLSNRARYEQWFVGGMFEGRPVHRVTNSREAKLLIERLTAEVRSSRLAGAA
ncbi:MAG TPA: AAA family ATPase [Phenylobacterium sp.]|uniref:AAA family ATPase n=1 Tax=Phenylobacterium sp. TaxID=1871053 RepID=UPI002C968929|nr:AAA family ATPase [Phenylobacterium sp.]HXA37692.1 AAA family ATPase [Phenylobacterium sp.]